jgi:DNA end-binding protein Ku
MAPPRSTGSAVLYFGLVSIPVKFYTATDEDEPVAMNRLHAKCGGRLKQQYVCVHDGELVGNEDMVKGYEVQKDQFVTFSKEEVEALEQPATATIEVAEFVPASTVDSLHYDKAHHLGPDRGAERSYALFAAALARAERVALARYSKKGRQHFAMVRSTDGRRLVLQQLLRAELVRSPAEIPLGSAEVMAPELELAMELVASLSAEKFRPDTYPDESRERTLKLIAEKVATKKISVAPTPSGPRVIVDLVEALKGSLGPRKGPKKAPRTARPRTVIDKAE